ncbi:MAG: (S)-sulfolactate dehydrogenase [Pseudomonadota bacterium]|jgi:phosphoglycerate dehydrogenase-like enzyme
MTLPPFKIVFHGQNAANFRQGFEALVGPAHLLVDVSDALDQPGERAHYESAQVIVGNRVDASLPTPQALRLYHAPAAGTDGIDYTLLPAASTLCNCHGHENAIAEYVMAALLLRHIPLSKADAGLRQGQWTYYAGRPAALRTELGQQTLGLLGFGHIAQTLAHRAKAFGMRVHAANRSAIQSPLVDQAFGLDTLPAFMASADAVVVSLPLAPSTQGIVDAAALHAMRPDAVIVNVGRGPVIEEQALYDALAQRRIAGAIIDTWYQYPTPTQPECAPSKLDFARLDNVVMTPHMSGWTTGTIARRQQTMANNIARLLRGEALMNVLKAAV